MIRRRLLQRFVAHLDPVLLALISLLLLTSVVVIYSASGGNWTRVLAQMTNILVACAALWIVANLPLHYLMRAAVPAYLLGMVLLIAVALFGEISNGARRWLNLGVTTIQPSELMRIAVPLMMAWYFEKHEAMLTLKNYFVATLLLLLPVALIARQPDLGTSIMIAASGFYVLFLAGISWRVMLTFLVIIMASMPVRGPRCTIISATAS